MNKLKIDDEVIITVGKDKGKKSKVKQINKDKNNVIVDKINIVKRHTKPSQTSPGGIIEKEAPVDVSNLMLVCRYCKKPTKVNISIVDDKKVRKCKKCGEVLDKK
jgi:large subunit ribosomal protein L24